MIGAVVVVYAGSVAIDQSSADISVSAAEEGMLSMEQQIQQLSGGDISKASVGFSGSANELRMLTSSSPEAGVMTITAGGTTKSYVLGTVKFERDGQVVAYQGGGVWRKSSNSDGSTAVSPPPVSYRATGGSETLSFPVVQIEGEAIGSDLTVRTVDRKSLLNALGLNRQPAPGTDIEVEIESEFYGAWADYLEAEIGPGPVSTVPADQKVVVKFRSPTSSTGGPISSGAFSDGPTSTISNAVKTDSYTSPTYPGWPAGSDGDVRTMKEFNLQNSPTINGDVHAMRGSSELKTSGGKVTGQVRLGCCAGPTSMKNGQTYESTFSTQDDIVIDAGSTFEGDVIVGGTTTHGNAYSLDVSGKATFEKDVHVHGNFEITEAQEPTFEEDIYVKDGDLELGDTKGQIDGSVYVKNGDVVTSSSAKQIVIDGDLVVSGSVDLDSKITVKGDVLAGGSFSKNGATVQGSEPPTSPAPSTRMPSTSDPGAFQTPLDPDVPERSPVDSRISTRGSTYLSSNNNDGASVTGVTTSNSLVSSCGCTLTAGNYYLSEIDMGSGETLTLDTGGGTINVYVRDSVRLQGATVKVKGGGRVNFWVGGHSTTGSGHSFYVLNPTKVITEDDTGARTHRAPGVWTYLKRDDTAELRGGNTDYTGVIYGPGDQKVSGGRRVIDVPGTEVTIQNSVDIYGAVVGHVDTFDNSARIHYDTNLGGSTVVPGSGSSSSAAVEFLTITRRTATVED